jgi:hypothetical protein
MGREDNHEDQAAVKVTGHMSELLQDSCRQLSIALSNTPHARRHAREASEVIREQLGQEKMWQQQE